MAKDKSPRKPNLFQAILGFLIFRHFLGGGNLDNLGTEVGKGICETGRQIMNLTKETPATIGNKFKEYFSVQSPTFKTYYEGMTSYVEQGIQNAPFWDADKIRTENYLKLIGTPGGAKKELDRYMYERKKKEAKEQKELEQNAGTTTLALGSSLL